MSSKPSHLEQIQYKPYVPDQKWKRESNILNNMDILLDKHMALDKILRRLPFQSDRVPICLSYYEHLTKLSVIPGVKDMYFLYNMLPNEN